MLNICQTYVKHMEDRRTYLTQDQIDKFHHSRICMHQLVKLWHQRLNQIEAFIRSNVVRFRFVVAPCLTQSLPNVLRRHKMAEIAVFHTFKMNQKPTKSVNVPLESGKNVFDVTEIGIIIAARIWIPRTHQKIVILILDCKAKEHQTYDKHM